MPKDLTGKTVAILATEGVEQVEFTSPRDALTGAGAIVHLVSPESEVQAFNHLDKGDTFPVDRPVNEANPGTYDALMLPGGVANPDALRMNAEAVAFVKGFLEAGKPVFAICHAAWTLIEADVVRDRRMTSWSSLQTDLRNAGADWVDEEVVVCNNGPAPLITSRKPDDLDAFNKAMIDCLAATA